MTNPSTAPHGTKRLRRERQSPIFVLLEFVGVVTGGLSLANLLRELGWVSLNSAVWQFLDFYATFVAIIVDVLFGWIDSPWVEITDAESHTLVLGSLLIAAAGRVAFGASRRASIDILRGGQPLDVDWDSETPPPEAVRFLWKYRHAMVRFLGILVGILVRMVLLTLIALMASVALAPGDQTIGLLVILLITVALLSPTLIAAVLMKVSSSYREFGHAAHRAVVLQLRRSFFLSVAAVIALAALIILADLAAQSLRLNI